MPLNIKKRREQTKAIVIQIDGDEITACYRPAERTLDASIQLQEKRGADQTRFYAEWLARVLTEWDVDDGEGGIYPITPESLAALDQEILTAIGEAIIRDASPKAPNGKP